MLFICVHVVQVVEVLLEMVLVLGVLECWFQVCWLVGSSGWEERKTQKI